jgi:hypothetical protein
MLISLATLLATLFSIFRSRAGLQLENLALRHQIGVLQRSARKRPKLTSVDQLATADPQFVFRLLPSIENTSFVGGGRTRRSHERFSRRKWGPSWRYRRSVSCTTATNGGLPERAPIYTRLRGAYPVALKSLSERYSVAQACIGEFGSADSSRAANRSSFAVRLEE